MNTLYLPQAIERVIKERHEKFSQQTNIDQYQITQFLSEDDELAC